MSMSMSNKHIVGFAENLLSKIGFFHAVGKVVGTIENKYENKE